MTRQDNGTIWASQRAKLHKHHENETTQTRQPLKKEKKKSHTIWVIWLAVVQLQSQSHGLTNMWKCEMWQLTNHKKAKALASSVPYVTNIDHTFSVSL